MPKPAVVVDYSRCQVEQCDLGVCPALQECPHHILRQEAPFELPDVHPGLCRGCARCMRACPFGAIQIQ